MEDLKMAFVDGDRVTWSNARRAEIAKEVACAITGMVTAPSKPASQYPRLIDGYLGTLKRIPREDGVPVWERETVTGEYGPELHEDEYCREDVERWNGVFYRTIFLPELVALDVPLPQAAAHLESLVRAGYEIWIISSNKAHTREARLAWMARYHLDILACSFGPGGHLIPNLILKPEGKQYTSTADWKASTIVFMVKERERSTFTVTDVVVADDADANLAAICGHSFWQSDEGKHVHIHGSPSLDLLVRWVERQRK